MLGSVTIIKYHYLPASETVVPPILSDCVQWAWCSGSSSKKGWEGAKAGGESHLCKTFYVHY